MKMKWYKQCWLWLMMLFGIVLINTVTRIRYVSIPLQQVLCSDGFWTAIGSVGTLISVIVAVASIVSNNERTKKQSTSEAFAQFKKNVEPYENIIHNYSDEKIREIIQEYEQDSHSKGWNQIKEYLAAVERFATGVNTKIYDVKIVNKMGGFFLCEQYQKLYPIIEYKREKDGNDCIYEEFRDMVNEIIEVRKKNNQLNMNPVK